MTTCSACGTPNVDGVKFCVNCGAQMPPPAESWRAETAVKEEVEQIYTPPTYTDTLPQTQHAQPPAYQTPTSMSSMQTGALPTIGMVLGIVALCVMGIGLVPFLGSLNYLTTLISLSAITTSLIALFAAKPFLNRNQAIIGLVFGSVALVLGLIRLLMGCCIF